MKIVGRNSTEGEREREREKETKKKIKSEWGRMRELENDKESIQDSEIIGRSRGSLMRVTMVMIVIIIKIKRNEKIKWIRFFDDRFIARWCAV